MKIHLNALGTLSASEDLAGGTRRPGTGSRPLRTHGDGHGLTPGAHGDGLAVGRGVTCYRIALRSPPPLQVGPTRGCCRVRVASPEKCLLHLIPVGAVGEEAALGGAPGLPGARRPGAPRGGRAACAEGRAATPPLGWRMPSPGGPRVRGPTGEGAPPAPAPKCRGRG